MMVVKILASRYSRDYRIEICPANTFSKTKAYKIKVHRVYSQNGRNLGNSRCWREDNIKLGLKKLVPMWSKGLIRPKRGIIKGSC